MNIKELLILYHVILVQPLAGVPYELEETNVRNEFITVRRPLCALLLVFLFREVYLIKHFTFQ